MTRCKYCSYSNQLKSSAYNPIGQCYELQLTAHKAMTNHLRRILTAKSVVDSGKTESKVSDKRSIKSRGNSNVACKRVNVNVTKESLSQDVINRIAYDTKRHPHEAVSFNWKLKNDNRSNSTDSSEDCSLSEDRKNCNDKFRADSKVYTRSLSSGENLRGFNDARRNRNNCAERDLKFGKSDSKTFNGGISRARSSLEISFPVRTSEFVAPFVGQTCDTINADRFSNDASIYVKFVYDITKEIMEEGYYSDREIEKVIEKHFKINVGILNENRMLREINCLRRSLNINYDSDEKEEAEDIFRFGLRNDNKSFKTTEKREAKNRKIDPQKEIIVTKEDVLTTLLEMDFNREQAEEICQSLENRSKELNLNEKQRETENLKTISNSGSTESTIQNCAEMENKKLDNSTDKNGDPIRDDRISSGSKSAVENLQMDDSNKVGKGGLRNGSEKQKINNINRNLDSKILSQESHQDISVSYQHTKLNGSSDINKISVKIAEEEINKPADLNTVKSSRRDCMPDFEGNSDTNDVVKELSRENFDPVSVSKITDGNNPTESA